MILTICINHKTVCCRFNSYDGRLDREMEAVVLVMEAFQGHEGRIQYDIVGHSGESHDITFIDHKNPPADNKQRLDIIKVCQPWHKLGLCEICRPEYVLGQLTPWCRVLLGKLIVAQPINKMFHIL
jgi:hypothetical protein